MPSHPSAIRPTTTTSLFNIIWGVRQSNVAPVGFIHLQLLSTITAPSVGCFINCHSAICRLFFNCHSTTICWLFFSTVPALSAGIFITVKAPSAGIFYQLSKHHLQALLSTLTAPSGSSFVNCSMINSFFNTNLYHWIELEVFNMKFTDESQLSTFL